MTSTLHKAIKQVLKEIDTFLTSTLRDQSLTKTAQKERAKLIESLQKLYNDYADFKPIQEQDDSKSVPPNPRLSSIGSQASEEADGNEDNIPQTTVAALKEPTRLGYLLQRKSGEGKQKLFKQKKDTKKYCVIHENIMYWFIKPSDKTFHGAVYLNGCDFKDLSRKEKEFVFQLDFISKNKSYEADNKEDLDKWKNAVEMGIKCAEQKEADVIDGRNTYPYEAVSTPATSSRKTAGVVSYVNETTKIEDEANVYFEPVFSSNDDDKINAIQRELCSSVPRERPPSPPNPPKHDTVPLPLSKGKGKAPKESKPAKTKTNEILATVTDKISKTRPLPSKIFPQNKKSPTSKPELFTEVKLKPVSVSVGKSPVVKESVSEEEDECGAIYEIVDNSHLAAFNSVSVPDSKPPELPQRGSHVYANEKDTDNLEYEL